MYVCKNVVLYRASCVYANVQPRCMAPPYELFRRFLTLYHRNTMLIHYYIFFFDITIRTLTVYRPNFISVTFDSVASCFPPLFLPLSSSRVWSWYGDATARHQLYVFFVVHLAYILYDTFAMKRLAFSLQLFQAVNSSDMKIHEYRTYINSLGSDFSFF